MINFKLFLSTLSSPMLLEAVDDKIVHVLGHSQRNQRNTTQVNDKTEE